MNRKFVLLMGMLLILFWGCEEKEPEILPREDLFSLSLGKLEDQIDLFQIEGVPVRTKNRIFMREGMFFVSNGNAGKVMKLSTYGDLLFLLYNPYKNPKPIVLKTDVDEGIVANLTAASFNLREIGEIAVDSKLNIYVEDQVAPEQRIVDDTLKLELASRVLRFDRKGNLIDYFGKEGIENSLLPYIEKIRITREDDLIIFCRAPGGWLVYGFSSGGKSLFHVMIAEEDLPRKNEGFGVLENIVADYTALRLYVVVSYYIEELDPATRTRTKITKEKTFIYPYDPVQGTYEEQRIPLPNEGVRKYYTAEGEVEIPAPSFEVLGITENRLFFLLRPDEESRYELVVIDDQGIVQARRFLIINDRELFIKELAMSPEGLIYGLMGGETKADFVLWRSDKIEGVMEE